MYQEASEERAEGTVACGESFMFDGVTLSFEQQPVSFETPANDVEPVPALGWVKRGLDITAGLALVLVFTPLMLFVALLIVLDSRGPVLFRQRRTGLNGEVFRILKFRTMAVLEDGDSVLQAVHGDPRVTRVGSLLRKSSLDELPQLFNVLSGEMSLVGPRPHAVAHDRVYRATLPGYDRRFAVKPGITGLAQIRGFRGPTASVEDAARRLSADLEYIREWSIPGDLRVLIKSAGVLVRHGGC